MNPRRDDQTDIRWLAVKNESGLDIPAYGVMAMIGLEVETGLILVDQPGKNDLDPALLLVNGPNEIAANDEGSGTHDGPMLVLYDTAGGIPVHGDSMGTVAGEWALQKGKVGFLFISEVEDSDDVGFMNNRYRALVGVECVDGEIVGQLPSLPDPL